jgi:sn-glycerol 3-phosphate transport system substrate-binding protein
MTRATRARSSLRLLAAVAAGLAGLAPAQAATQIEWWHAMSGELGRQLEKLATDFNATQRDYRIVPVYKGNYTETTTAAIFAFRSRTQPAIVQVNEIATATMMAAKGAIYPVFELMRDEKETFSPSAYLPSITGYYTDLDGNMLSFPFNASTPILYYNKTLFRKAGLDPDRPPQTWPEVGAAAKQLRASGAACGFSTHWPSWINIENFSAYHDIPIATKANGMGGLDAALTINNPLIVRHIAQLAEWQKTKVFDYAGRATTGEPRFQNGECGIFHRLVRQTRADILKNAKFRGRLRACCLTGRTSSRCAAATPSSAARRCGCCAAVRQARNTRARRSSSRSCRGRRCRRQWHQNDGLSAGDQARPMS